MYELSDLFGLCDELARHFRRLCRGSIAVEDLAQAAKMAVWEASAGMEPPYRAEPLLKAAKRAIKKELKAALCQQPIVESDVFAFAPDRDEDSDALDGLDCRLDDQDRGPTYSPNRSLINFRDALREMLTEDEMEVLERVVCFDQAESMRDHRGFADIAEEMGTTVAEVKSLLLSARTKAAEMDPRYVRRLRRRLRTAADDQD